MFGRNGDDADTSPISPGGRAIRPEPPFPPDLVARLHAGVLDDRTAHDLWPAVLADPDAAELVRSLDAVRAGLAESAGSAGLTGSSVSPVAPGSTVSADPAVPADPADPAGATASDPHTPDATPPAAPMDGSSGPDAVVPAHVSARLRHALLAASDERHVHSAAPTGPPVGPADEHACTGSRSTRAGEGSASDARRVAHLRPRRSRALLTSAAAVVIGAVLIAAPTLWAAAGDDGTSAAVAEDAPPSTGTHPGLLHAGSAHGDPDHDGRASGVSDRPAARSGGSLTPAQILSVDGRDDPGPFSDPSRLAACLAANGLPPHSRLLGSGPVEVDGRKGTLLLVPGPRPPKLTGLVVTDACGRRGNGLLYRSDVGG